ncbi:MAG: hypothetical protein GF331_13420 [Chitinivibrionales bacterium]|nr:hypothetical protein [Chitinivibrionales bacterium]
MHCSPVFSPAWAHERAHAGSRTARDLPAAGPPGFRTLRPAVAPPTAKQYRTRAEYPGACTTASACRDQVRAPALFLRQVRYAGSRMDLPNLWSETVEGAGVATTTSMVIRDLGERIDYSGPDRSFSPHYSDIGLGFDGKPGVTRLHLHYNRRTIELGAPFIAVSGGIRDYRHAPYGVVQVLEAGGMVRTGFYAPNAFVVRASKVGTVTISFVHESMTMLRANTREGWVSVECLLPTGDKRDPDTHVPFIAGVRVLEGSLQGDIGDGTVTITGADIAFAVAARCLDVAWAEIAAKLRDAPTSCDDCENKTRLWLSQGIGMLRYSPETQSEAVALATAVHVLLSNACLAPGRLSSGVSSFPSRGTYPTHFLWDSCFQNLALEKMDWRLAPDSLLLLTRNTRVDGKMPHFACSTWVRPHASQPPLAGWAAERLVRERDDKELAAALLPALVRNTRWWIRQRTAPGGLVFCSDPLETGWDDTPRLDNGPIIACDMNAYVLKQMHSCVYLAELLGRTEQAENMRLEADRFGRAMLEQLYDRHENVFRDVLVETDQQQQLLTPACFLPLWAGVPLPEQEARDMIERHLLDKSKFFGDIPFPSVAYDQPVYDPKQWWRGPTWLPVAYLMLETLRKYGFEKQWRQAAERLHRMIVDDGRISELFNSQTGEGMGAAQQGWTAAILLRLNRELREA